jgi:hypothetical protein
MNESIGINIRVDVASDCRASSELAYVPLQFRNAVVNAIRKSKVGFFEVQAWSDHKTVSHVNIHLQTEDMNLIFKTIRNVIKELS